MSIMGETVIASDEVIDHYRGYYSHRASNVLAEMRIVHCLF